MDFGVHEPIDDASHSADTVGDLGNFECNICFELAQEPILTLCGHLYCWPCLYQWLQHSLSHECPVCKAIVQEEKLVPIYGRGKTSRDPRTRDTIPNRPVGQRPRTAPRVDNSYIRPNGLDPTSPFMPMNVPRFGPPTLSALFGALPAIFNFQVHGFNDATVYGTTSGFPQFFPSSFHGGMLGWISLRILHIKWFTQYFVKVSQFHSDLSLFDLNGKEIMRKTISVNDPLRYGGITIYQTDWSLSALQIMKDDEGPFNLALAPLQINGDKKLYGTFLPVGDADSTKVKGISMLARDMQSIVLYDQEGKFAGVRRPNSKLPIEIDGIKIVVLDAIGSTGLELKTDPGVPIVYAGFGALMLTTCISFLSHTQIWALQDGTTLVVGGKTNRAKGEFPDDMNFLLDQVPELVESSPPSIQANSTSG